MDYDNFVALVFIVGILSLLGFAIWHKLSPNNPISKRLRAFSNHPSLVAIREAVLKVALFGFLALIAIIGIAWYFGESSYYPREREVEVFFKAHSWIEGLRSTFGRKGPHEVDQVLAHLFGLPIAFANQKKQF